MKRVTKLSFVMLTRGCLESTSGQGGAGGGGGGGVADCLENQPCV